MNETARMERLGRYQIREIIGEGAMARVYKAYDPGDQPRHRGQAAQGAAAPPTRTTARASCARRRARACCRTRTSSRSTTSASTSDRPYIAEELVEGMTLADLMRPARSCRRSEIVEIGIQLARALDYAHRRGIIHRDVKPGNIMLVADTTQVKVADFGICRIDRVRFRGADAGDAARRRARHAELHVARAGDGRRRSTRAPICSRPGVVLYKLVTGALPFEGDSIITVAVKIAQTEAPTIDKLQRRRAVVAAPRRSSARCSKQPDKRFQTGEEMAQALAGVAASCRKPRSARSGRHARHPARRALGADHGGAGGADDERHRDDPLPAPVPGDDEPGDGVRRVAREVHGVAERGAAAAEDWAAIEVFIQETMPRQNFPLPGRRRRRRAPCAAATIAAQGQREVRAAGRPAPLPSPDPVVAVQQFTDGDGTQGARLRGADPVPGQEDRRRAPRHLRGAAVARRAADPACCSRS